MRVNSLPKEVVAWRTDQTRLKPGTFDIRITWPLSVTPTMMHWVWWISREISIWGHLIFIFLYFHICLLRKIIFRNVHILRKWKTSVSKKLSNWMLMENVSQGVLKLLWQRIRVLLHVQFRVEHQLGSEAIQPERSTIRWDSCCELFLVTMWQI